MERFIKVAIVDNNDDVSSAALFLGLKLCKTHPEIVKKWVTEVQEKLTSKNTTVHFHAMLLLYEMKKNDSLALSKYFESMMNLTLKSPLAQAQLIRFIRYSLKTTKFESSTMSNIEKYLADCLKKSQDMVVYEASKTLCEHSANRGPTPKSQPLLCASLQSHPAAAGPSPPDQSRTSFASDRTGSASHAGTDRHARHRACRP